MPSSFVDSFAPIVHLLIERAPQRVLDIGAGWGKYGLACREYLPDIEWLAGIEVPEGRLTTQDAIYDHMFVGDVRNAPDSTFQGYDIALVIDVIEHMTLDEGHQLLATIQGAGCAPLVSTPKVFTEQHDHANPYETHVSVWDWNDFAPHRIWQDASTIDSIIYLLRPRPLPANTFGYPTTAASSDTSSAVDATNDAESNGRRSAATPPSPQHSAKQSTETCSATTKSPGKVSGSDEI